MMRKKMTALLAALFVMAFAVGAQAMNTPAAMMGASQGMGMMQATQAPQAMGMHAMTPVEALASAANPKYPVGTQVILETDHMPGMQGAKGVVSGAYDTTLYAVGYTTSDGTQVKDHRWVIAEEIENTRREGRSRWAIR